MAVRTRLAMNMVGFHLRARHLQFTKLTGFIMVLTGFHMKFDDLRRITERTPSILTLRLSMPVKLDLQHLLCYIVIIYLNRIAHRTIHQRAWHISDSLIILVSWQ